MTDSDNKKLDLLLSLRELIRAERTIAHNNSVNINYFYMKDHDEESVAIYNRLRDYVKMKYERDSIDREELLGDIDAIIDRTCDHDFIDDEIEHVYSGNLMKIRYCRVCEKMD